MTAERNTKCSVPVCRRGLRQADDAWQGTRDLHDREFGVAAEGILAGQAHDEVEALVLDARKRPRRIEPQRRQYRFDFLREVVGQPLALRVA